jgi:D-cysteine desulfhydrase
VNTVGSFSPGSLRRLRQGEAPPLFTRFPDLGEVIPWRPLGTFPTPVERMGDLAGPGGAALWVKRDDLCSGTYGGNKVRKLEHLLGEAELSGAETLITLGAIGSNHGLATAIHGASAGFTVDLALYDQPVSPYVRRNLAGFAATGARVHDAGSIPAALLASGGIYARRRRAGENPYFIMVGGTSRLGCLGYVSAGLELADQIASGQLPEPDAVFLPLGTCGTAAGLLVGLKLARSKARLKAVRVADAFPAHSLTVRLLAQDVADYLHALDPTVPRLRIRDDDFDVITTHLGTGYGYPTEAAAAAIRLAEPQLGLDPTYSGKALAACLDHSRGIPGGNVLFWNTFNSARVPTSPDLSGLPPRLRRIAAG